MADAMLPLGMRLALPLLLLLLATVAVKSVTPTAELTVSGGTLVYVAPAAFGSLIPAHGDAEEKLLVLPAGLADGCAGMEPQLPEGFNGAFMVVAQRGNCSFDDKARAAQDAGASALLVLNTLEGVYQGKTFALDKQDYECANGEGWLPAPASPAWHPSNDVASCSGDSRCAAGACVLTNQTDPQLGTRVCCAWDLYLTMGASDEESVAEVTLQAAFLTMRAGTTLLADLSAPAGQSSVAEVFGALDHRQRSDFNLSSLLLWALGVATATYAAYRSGDEVDGRVASAAASVAAAKGRRSPPGTVVVALATPVLPVEAGVGTHHQNTRDDSGALNLGMGHTVAFVAFASGVLLVLFYFDLSAIVTIMFCISGTSAVAVVMATPLLRPVFAAGRRGLGLDNSNGHSGGTSCLVDCGWFGRVSLLETSAWLLSGAMALHWFLVRRTASYAWLLQDTCGCCLCILFLATIRVSNLRVAAALLSLAFCYDIFWVFLSPLLLGDSVMVEVATGGEPKQDAAYCEKYPTDQDCYSDGLPMLLLLPRVGDYLGGYVMLGLGDIVLPGLLLAFAHRYDSAAGLSLWRGYFPYMILGYAVGLMMANVAVYVTETGQPALLYLVPCTLGLFCFISWMDGSLPIMWNGPPELAPSSCGPSPPLLLGIEVGRERAASGGGPTDGDWPHEGYRPVPSPSQLARRGSGAAARGGSGGAGNGNGRAVALGGTDVEQQRGERGGGAGGETAPLLVL